MSSANFEGREMSHRLVHPVGVPPAASLATASLTSKHVQGMPGTVASLALRLSQCVFAVIAFSIMVTTPDFSTVTAFCYLVAATALQSIWSLSLALVDGYTMLMNGGNVKEESIVASMLTVGDWVTSMLTLGGACASAGITTFISKDLDDCAANHCKGFEAAITMTFFTCFLAFSSFFFSFWLLASLHQR